MIFFNFQYRVIAKYIDIDCVFKSLWQLSTCISEIHSSIFYRPKMVARACIGEVLVQVWSELLDKQVKSLKKSFWGSRKLLQAHKKVSNKNERNKQKIKHL